MLEVADLKNELHRPINPLDKLLALLASFDEPVQVADLRTRAKEAGFTIPKNWNVSSKLSGSKGKAIRVPEGWEITQSGEAYLRLINVKNVGTSKVSQTSSDLRKHLSNIKNPDTRAFVEEAIKCHETKLYRSAIVMSWIAAVDVLYREVVANHLSAFNTEAKKVDSSWKTAKNEDGLSRMKEAFFMDRLVGIQVIGKNVKDELSGALKLRNGCGHPNSLKVGPKKVESHMETLLQNVFEKFSA